LATGCFTRIVRRPKFGRADARRPPTLERPGPTDSEAGGLLLSRPSSVLTRPLLYAILVTTLCCGTAYWLIGMPPLLGAEDAAIGFRYARNLANGFGIVFNPGGEHVEGFTSLSWLFLSAAVYAVFGAAGLEQALGIVSLGLTVFAVAVVVRLLERISPRGPPFWIGIAWLGGQAGFWFWSGLSLMDVAPWAAGIAAFVLLVHRRLGGAVDARGGSTGVMSGTWDGLEPGASAHPAERVVLGLVVVLLALTRPEAMTVVPGAIVVAGLAYGSTSRFRTLALEVGITIVLAVGALTLFRLAYFGYPLPNTYYMKVSPDVPWRVEQGLRYVWAYASAHPLSWLAAVSIVFALAARAARLGQSGPPVSEASPGARPSALASFVGGVIVVGFASVVFGGGDHYQGHRFLQGYLPLAAVPIAAALAALQRALARRYGRDAGSGPARGRSAAGAPAWLAVGAVVLLLPSEWREYRSHDLRIQAFDVGLQGRFVGATLNEVFEGGAKPELGLWMVGGASYAYDGPVKDLLGLNWIAMGTSAGDRKGPRDHAAFNVDVFWSAPPDLMVPEPEAVLGRARCLRRLVAGIFRGLLTSPRFMEAFEPVRVRRGDSEPIIAYARSDWAASAPPTVERLGWTYCTGEG
jgi:arabinofuranosyltransferase